MAALTTDTPREYAAGGPRSENLLPVKGSTTLYEGMFLGDDASGYARGLSASDPFLGIAWRAKDNASGSDGDVNVEVIDQGEIEIAVTGASKPDDVGRTVYAADSGTLTLSAVAGSEVGKVARWITGTTCRVAFQAVQRRSV